MSWTGAVQVGAKPLWHQTPRCEEFHDLTLDGHGLHSNPLVFAFHPVQFLARPPNTVPQPRSTLGGSQVFIYNPSLPIRWLSSIVSAFTDISSSSNVQITYFHREQTKKKKKIFDSPPPSPTSPSAAVQ
mmetsp:Transcript_6190/g.12155  ORF Transcript_6190/g.12155 Transcript_6190/m.12155 type:complete len:129 (+) Transcript_6190:802-1188(+)